MVPLLDYKELEDDEKIFGESYDSEDDENDSEQASDSFIEPIREIVDYREDSSEDRVNG